MPGYSTRLVTLRVGQHDYRLRALSDRRQFANPQQSHDQPPFRGRLLRHARKARSCAGSAA